MNRETRREKVGNEEWDEGDEATDGLRKKESPYLSKSAFLMCVWCMVCAEVLGLLQWYTYSWNSIFDIINSEALRVGSNLCVSRAWVHELEEKRVWSLKQHCIPFLSFLPTIRFLCVREEPEYIFVCISLSDLSNRLHSTATGEKEGRRRRGKEEEGG